MGIPRSHAVEGAFCSARSGTLLNSTRLEVAPHGRHLLPKAECLLKSEHLPPRERSSARSGWRAFAGEEDVFPSDPSNRTGPLPEAVKTALRASCATCRAQTV